MKFLSLLLMAGLTIAPHSSAIAQSDRARARDNVRAWAVCMWDHHPAEAAIMEDDEFWKTPPRSYLDLQGAVNVNKFCRMASPFPRDTLDFQKALKGERTGRQRVSFFQCMVADQMLVADISALANYALTEADRRHYRPILEEERKAFAELNKVAVDKTITDGQIATRRYLDQPVPPSFKSRAANCDRDMWRSLEAGGNASMKAEMITVLRVRDGGKP